MSLNESAGASVVKVASVAAGAAMSGMNAVSQTIGSTGQELIWFVTFAYGVLQLYKALPWATMQTAALFKGLRHGDWSDWRAIAKREQKSNDGGSI
jgi:hypothetical protein